MSFSHPCIDRWIDEMFSWFSITLAIMSGSFGNQNEITLVDPIDYSIINWHHSVVGKSSVGKKTSSWTGRLQLSYMKRVKQTGLG